MIQVSATGFASFLTAFSAADRAGAGPLPVGGNEFLLPEDTDPAVVDAIERVSGVTVTDRPATPAPAKKTRTTGKE